MTQPMMAELDCTESVDTVMERWPATAPVFVRFGVDTCCGAGASIEEAADRDGADKTALCAALREAVAAA